MRDPYETLGVSKNATPDEIKSAFRKLARQHHPDVNPGNPEAEEKFKDINQAYSILSDPEKKARFDQFGTTDEQAGGFNFQGGGNFGDLFEMFFGGGFGGQAGPRSRVRDGDDLRSEVHLKLVDVLNPIEKKLKYRRYSVCPTCKGFGTQDGSTPDRCDKCNGSGSVTRMQQTFFGTMQTSTPCGTCGGTGEKITKACTQCKGNGLVLEEVENVVTIPAGVDDGMTLRVQGKGSDGVRGGQPGDLYVSIYVASDDRFERHGNELATTVELTYVQAVLGDEIEVQGLDEDFDVEIPPGTTPGSVLRIREGGIPSLRGGRRGDLLLQIEVQIPKKITDEQAELLRNYAKSRGERVPEPKAGGLLGGLFKKKK